MRCAVILRAHPRSTRRRRQRRNRGRRSSTGLLRHRRCWSGKDRAAREPSSKRTPSCRKQEMRRNGSGNRRRSEGRRRSRSSPRSTTSNRLPQHDPSRECRNASACREAERSVRPPSEERLVRAVATVEAPSYSSLRLNQLRQRPTLRGQGPYFGPKARGARRPGASAAHAERPAGA